MDAFSADGEGWTAVLRELDAIECSDTVSTAVVGKTVAMKHGDVKKRINAMLEKLRQRFALGATASVVERERAMTRDERIAEYEQMMVELFEIGSFDVWTVFKTCDLHDFAFHYADMCWRAGKGDAEKDRATGDWRAPRSPAAAKIARDIIALVRKREKMYKCVGARTVPAADNFVGFYVFGNPVTAAHVEHMLDACDGATIARALLSEKYVWAQDVLSANYLKFPESARSAALSIMTFATIESCIHVSDSSKRVEMNAAKNYMKERVLKGVYDMHDPMASAFATSVIGEAFAIVRGAPNVTTPTAPAPTSTSTSERTIKAPKSRKSSRDTYAALSAAPALRFS